MKPLDPNAFRDPRVHLVRDGIVHSKNYQARDLRRAFIGAYVPAIPTDSADQWTLKREVLLANTRAAVAAFGPDEVAAYGVTALVAMGVAHAEQLQDWERSHIEVALVRGRIRVAGVVAHRSLVPPVPVMCMNRLPLLHPVDHALQIPRATQASLVEILDGFMRYREPLLSHAALLQRIAELHGVWGIKKVRAAAPYAQPGTDSIMETRTRLKLVGAGLPIPVINYAFFCPYNQITYRFDMAYLKQRIAVEFDGLVHVASREQMEHDNERRLALSASGWDIFTFTAKQLRNPDRLLRLIKETFARKS